MSKRLDPGETKGAEVTGPARRRPAADTDPPKRRFERLLTRRTSIRRCRLYGADTVVLCGIATDWCVLSSAFDALLRTISRVVVVRGSAARASAARRTKTVSTSTARAPRSCCYAVTYAGGLPGGGGRGRGGVGRDDETECPGVRPGRPAGDPAHPAADPEAPRRHGDLRAEVARPGASRGKWGRRPIEPSLLGVDTGAIGHGALRLRHPGVPGHRSRSSRRAPGGDARDPGREPRRRSRSTVVHEVADCIGMTEEELAEVWGRRTRSDQWSVAGGARAQGGAREQPERTDPSCPPLF